MLAASFTSPPNIYIRYTRYTRCELVEPSEYPRDIVFPTRSPLFYWSLIVPFRGRYNINPFFQISRPKKPFFSITMRKVTKSKSLSTVRRKRLVKFIFREGIEIRPYTNCIKRENGIQPIGIIISILGTSEIRNRRVIWLYPKKTKIN